MTGEGLTIKEIERRTGVQASTLRIWELRHGFPSPARLPSGHRRYSDHDAELVRRVLELRGSGLSLPAAIERAHQARSEPEPSIYGALRRLRPDLGHYALPKRLLVAVSHAIEDECASAVRRQVLIGAFQEQRFYRADQPRWRDMARSAGLAVVLSDFPERRDPDDGGPIELPNAAWDPGRREWLIVCDAEGSHTCLAAWERPGQGELPDGERLFEVVWSLDPSTVREVIRMIGGRLVPTAPDVAEALLRRAEELPTQPSDGLRLASSMISRMLSYVASQARVPVSAG